MVVRILFSQLIPSDRGLSRDEDITNVEDAREWYRSVAYDTREYRQLPIDQGKSSLSVASAPLQHSDGLGVLPLSERPFSHRSLFRGTSSDSKVEPFLKPKTTTKKKRFRAVTCLTSLASDLDVISDWVFLVHIYKKHRKHQEEYEENLFPPLLLFFLFFVCIAGSIMWLILATEGRLIAPILRRVGIDKMSIGYALFACVLVEDIPQVVLTFLLEDYYGTHHNISDFALINVVTSLYDTLIKLAESYDERDDIIETGDWCRHSIWAHNHAILSVIALPSPDISDGDSDSKIVAPSSFSSRRSSPKFSPDTSSRKRLSRVYLPPQSPTRQLGTSTRQSIVDQTADNIVEPKVNSIRCLSSSFDRSVRLWETPFSTLRRDYRSRKNEVLVRAYKGHKGAVTCISFLGRKLGDSCRSNDDQDDETEFFLTGGRDGIAKLWNLQSGDCIKSYVVPNKTGKGGKNSRVTSIASVLKWETFVCGYQVGVVRLWGIWSEQCLVQYCGHLGPINSVCSMEDSRTFLSGSVDSTIRLWSADKPTTVNIASISSLSDKSPGAVVAKGPESPTQGSSDEPKPENKMTCHIELKSEKTYLGHTGPVLSITCVEPRIAFLTGSKDKTARLWSAESGVCLRIFSGHTKAVTTVEAVDQVTFLTGSEDSTIKIWDAVTAESLRTYTGHKGAVTSVSMAQDGTFVSCGNDQTIKFWVFTAVTPDRESGEGGLDEILAINDNTCSDAMCTSLCIADGQ